MHEDNEDDGKGILKRPSFSDCNILLFKALYQVKKNLQTGGTNYLHIKEKEEIFAICSLIERLSLIILIKSSFLVSKVRKR